MSKSEWGEGNVYQRGETWWVVYHVNGHRCRESAKTTDERKARQYLRKKLTAAEQGELPKGKITVDVLLDNLLEFYETNNPKSLGWARIVVNTHFRGKRAAVNNLCYRRAATFGTADIQEYVRARRAKHISNGTINRELALLRRAFNLGMQHEPPLIQRAPRIPKLAEAAPRRGFFEAEHFDRLRPELPEEVRDVAVFAYWTGCRKSEILGLEWDQVIGSTIRLEETKNGEQREIPLVGELAEMLERRKKEREERWPFCKFVFCREGKRIVNFYTSWKSACERAGFGDSNRLLHDFRRTGVRNLIRAGVPEKVAMLISGHKTRSVFDRYHIVQGDDTRDAMNKLATHLGNGKKK